ELVAALRRQREADQPAPLLRHEVDRLGRRELRGEREVALVLAVLVVADDDHLALADVLDRLLDGGEARRRLLTAHRSTSFSTYFASTSTSRLTVRPGTAEPRLVRSRVSGIRETLSDSASTALTVRLTPSTAIDPFSTTYRSRSGAAAIRTTRAKPSSRTSAIVPSPSTWPCTKCPPRRSCGRSGSSRFTRSPCARAPSDERASVSFMTSAPKTRSRVSIAVRHTPLTAIESPSAAPSGKSAAIVRRAPSPDRSIATTCPIPCTSPVNTSPLPQPRGDEQILPDALAVERQRAQHFGDRLDPLALERVARGAP